MSTLWRFVEIWQGPCVEDFYWMKIDSFIYENCLHQANERLDHVTKLKNDVRLITNSVQWTIAWLHDILSSILYGLYPQLLYHVRYSVEYQQMFSTIQHYSQIFMSKINESQHLMWVFCSWNSCYFDLIWTCKNVR